MKRMNLIRAVALIAVCAGLWGCGGADKVTPGDMQTTVATQVQAAVAAQVQATLTASALVEPSATPVPPIQTAKQTSASTATVEPTMTTLPTDTPVPPTPTPVPTAIALSIAGAPAIWGLQPTNGSVVFATNATEALSFSAQFYDGVQGEQVDIDSVRITLDDRDVTEDAQVSQYGILYTPDDSLDPGEHILTLDIGDQAGHSAPQLVWSVNITYPSITSGRAQIVQGDIKDDTTWQAGNVYVLEQDVAVARDAILSIEAGAVIKFDQWRGLFVDGTLQVQGTAEMPVVFTSLKDDAYGGDSNEDGTLSSPTPGDWRGVIFRGESKDSDVSQALFRYGGNYEYYGIKNVGAVHIESASPTVTNSTFENNAWYAFSADMRSEPSLSGNVLLNNGGNGLEIRESDTGNDNRIWSNTDISYMITGDVVVANPSVLAIEPGVIVKFAQWRGLFVDGTLRVEGNADAPVVFTSWKDDEYGGDTNNDASMSSSEPGDWRAVTFRAASTHASGNSVIDHALFRYGGNYEYYGIKNVGAVHMESASPTVTNSTFENNAWYAFSADMRSTPSVSGNVLLNNGGNGLEIRESDTGDDNRIWSNTDIPYVITGDVVVANPSVLAIEPGVIVKFAQWRGLFIDGTLRVEGNADAPVVFTSWQDDEYGGDTNNDASKSSPEPGDWRAITFRAASTHASGDSVIDHALFRYGGNYEYYGVKDVGAVHIEAGKPTISNSTITQNIYGIWYAKEASPVLIDDNIEGNVKGNVQVSSE